MNAEDNLLDNIDYLKQKLNEAREELERMKNNIKNAQPVTVNSLNYMKDVLEGYYEIGIGRYPKPNYVFLHVD